MIFLLDSTVLIDHLNGIEAATHFLGDVAGDSCLSVITRAEVLAGYATPPPAVKELLNRWTVLPLEGQDADLAARLRHRHHWKLPDAFQAALATRYKLKLATRNSRDFSPSKHTFVKIPYRL